MVMKNPNTPVASVIREMKNSFGSFSIFHDTRIPVNVTTAVRTTSARDIASIPVVNTMLRESNHLYSCMNTICSMFPEDLSVVYLNTR